VFIETSAKTGVNVEELFTQIAQKLVKLPKASNDDGIEIVKIDGVRRSGCCF
jgi:GTPase SAR1 family protein